MRSDSHKFTLMLIGWIAAGLIGAADPAHAQESNTLQTRDRGSYQLQETEITGKLRDVLGSLRLLETEIVGTVERPRLDYSLPWKDPIMATVVCNFKEGCLPPGDEMDPLLLEEGEVPSGLYEKLYSPLDKETFDREIRLGKAGAIPLSGKETE